MGDPIPDVDKLRERLLKRAETLSKPVSQNTADLLREAASLLRTQEAELSRLRQENRGLEGTLETLADEIDVFRLLRSAGHHARSDYVRAITRFAREALASMGGNDGK